MLAAIRIAVLLAVCLVLSGCQKYHAQPLLVQDMVLDVDRVRHSPDGESVDPSAPASEKIEFSFKRASDLMKVHSPALREVRSEFETALALTKVKTPLPNPGVEVGPQFGFGPDIGTSSKVTPFASFGFAIPTGGRLKRQDELNKISAEMARIEAVVRHRELYFELRKSYMQLALAKARFEARNKINISAEQSVLVVKRLIESGFGTALDSGLLELEQARQKMELANAQNEVVKSEGELSVLIGVHTDHFQVLPQAALPVMSENITPLDDLKSLLILNNPQLARLRASYEVSERQLHLEIARQYPDFRIGPSFDRETGERKSVLGLTLGIDFPIFDRNQQAVATATKRREEIRSKYIAAANRALANTERAWRSHKLALEKLKLIREVLLPKAQKNIELGSSTLEAGTSDALRFLETERGQRAIMIEAIEAEVSVRESLIEMEQAVGYPLVLFPLEVQHDIPELQESTHADASVPSSTPGLELDEPKGN